MSTWRIIQSHNIAEINDMAYHYVIRDTVYTILWIEAQLFLFQVFGVTLPSIQRQVHLCGVLTLI